MLLSHLLIKKTPNNIDIAPIKPLNSVFFLKNNQEKKNVIKLVVPTIDAVYPIFIDILNA